TPEKIESEEEDGIENELENNENIEDCDSRKTIKVKPFGGPLLAQAEISSSQQDFFKMLDEKIQNGPDYNSESETEKAAEAARLSALLKDWETASAGSRSLPTTPKRRPKPPLTEKLRPDGIRSAEICRDGPRPPERGYVSQYQAISPMYSSQPTYQPPPRQYPSYNQHGSPIKTYMNNSPKHIPYDQPASYSPSHKLYGPPVPVVKPVYSNGELLQQQFYNQMQYQQYKEARDQVLVQNQQPAGYRMQRNYQTSVTIPIVVQNQQNDMNALHRKQYELT
ncbi:RNA polymerase II degradation factor 1, partial [Asbolus verrucosus]